MTDDAVTAQLARQAQQLDDLEQAVTDLRTAPPPAAKPATVPPRWATLAEFVEHVIAPLCAQPSPATGHGAPPGGTTRTPASASKLSGAHGKCYGSNRRPGSPDGCATSPTPSWTGSATGTAARSGPAVRASTWPRRRCPSSSPPPGSGTSISTPRAACPLSERLKHRKDLAALGPFHWGCVPCLRDRSSTLKGPLRSAPPPLTAEPLRIAGTGRGG